VPVSVRCSPRFGEDPRTHTTRGTATGGMSDR
jgi:hypothetical protein